jgi:hypothetical protein
MPGKPSQASLKFQKSLKPSPQGRSCERYFQTLEVFRKGLPLTHTLAYLAFSLKMKKNSFIKLAPVVSFIKLFYILR